MNIRIVNAPNAPSVSPIPIGECSYEESVTSKELSFFQANTCQKSKENTLICKAMQFCYNFNNERRNSLICKI